MIAIEARTRELEMALGRLASAAGVDYGMVIKEEAKYVTQHIMKFTRPKQRKDGVQNMQVDIRKLAVPLDYNYFNSRATKGGFYKSIAGYIRRRNTDKLNELFRLPNLASLSWLHGKVMLGSYQELAAKHVALRDRFGRIRANRPFAAYRKVGLASRVGWHLAGWIPTAKATGAKYKKFAEKLANKAGVVTYDYTSKNPFIISRNLNVKIPRYQQIVVRPALSGRIAVTERKLQRVLAGHAVNLGFVRVKGDRLPPAATPPLLSA
jgi:hypothetical protein